MFLTDQRDALHYGHADDRFRTAFNLMNAPNGYVRWNCEITDTFGGEANYSWVRRGTTLIPEGASHLTIMRKVKAELGLSGVRCRVSDHGDMIELRPYGQCTVAFATVTTA